jgi:hypothetical protein
LYLRGKNLLQLQPKTFVQFSPPGYLLHLATCRVK